MYELPQELPNDLRHAHSMFADGRAESPHKKSKRPMKLENFKKIPEVIGFDGEYPAVHPKAKFWRLLVKNCKKSAVNHSTEKPILVNFVNVFPKCCPTFSDETDFYF